MTVPDHGYTTLGDYADDCVSLGPAAFRVQHAEAFLVAPRTCVLKPPPRPSATMIMTAISLTARPAVPRPDYEPGSLVFPLRRRQNAIFSFISIGRAGNADVTIPDTTLSKLHAVIVQEGTAFILEDARSANGTFLNGQRVLGHGQGAPSVLAAADRVRFGNVELGFFPADDFRRLVQGATRPT